MVFYWFQALSALEDDNHRHYKATVMKSIEDVLIKFQFADAPAVEQWNRDYAGIKENDIDEVRCEGSVSVRMCRSPLTLSAPCLRNSQKTCRSRLKWVC